MFTRLADDALALLKKTGSSDKTEALAAQRELAKSLQIDIRKNLLENSTTSLIYRSVPVGANTIASFPLDVFAPDETGEFIGYTIPGHGRIPERMIEGDSINIGTFKTGSSIDWLLDYAADGREDVVGACVAILEASFIRKDNLDAWYAILATAASRGQVIFDSLAPAGMFSKRLVTNMQTFMRRSVSNSSTAINPIRLTDLFLSPEGLEGMRNWDLTIVDDQTRREIFSNLNTGGLNRIFGVNLHELLELGVGQVYQQFLTDLGATMGTNDLNADGDNADPNEGPDTQFVVGLDLSNPNVFLNPVRRELEIWEDEALHRQQRAGYYGWQEKGFGVLSKNRTLLGSF